ncbi:MAG: LPXTG cell wall anchor domain-containing protein [Peptococcaceae bacterium]|nr:LPXTG cell wall anchor domain-containing protein [Peptococcaceae bacterium]
MMVTVVAAVGVYYQWSVVWQKNDNAGIALGIITAILVSAFFTRLKRRKK